MFVNVWCDHKHIFQLKNKSEILYTEANVNLWDRVKRVFKTIFHNPEYLAGNRAPWTLQNVEEDFQHIRERREETTGGSLAPKTECATCRVPMCG